MRGTDFVLATIHANGNVYSHGDVLGKMETIIKGDEYVESISFSRSFLEDIIKREIREGKNQLLPCFRPKGNSMLQALATIQKYYKQEDIRVEGEIPGKVYDDDTEDGVIY